MSKLFEDIEFIICDVALLWRKVHNAEFKSLGISPNERRILITIARYPGITQIELAQKIEMEPQNISRAIHCLEEYIEKKPAKHDRRINCLFLTTKGTNLMKRIDKVSKKIHKDIMSFVDSSTEEQITHKLSIINENLKSYLEGR